MKMTALGSGLALGASLMLTGCSSTREAQYGHYPTPHGMFSGSHVTMDVARLYERQGSYDRAESAYKELMQKSPQDASPVHRLGVLAVRQGKLDEAERLFAQAMTLAPPDAELLTDAGYLYYLQSRYGEAETLLRQSLSKVPGNQRTLNNLGMVLARQDREQESLAVFRQAKGQADAHTSLGFVLAQNGQMEKAQFHLGRALDIDPDHKPAAQGLVEIASRRGVRQQSPASHESFQTAGVQEQPASRSDLPESQGEYARDLMARLSAGGAADSAVPARANPFVLEAERPSPAEERQVAKRVPEGSLFRIEAGPRTTSSPSPVMASRSVDVDRATIQTEGVGSQNTPRRMLVTLGQQTVDVEVPKNAGRAVARPEITHAAARSTSELTTAGYSVASTSTDSVVQAGAANSAPTASKQPSLKQSSSKPAAMAAAVTENDHDSPSSESNSGGSVDVQPTEVSQKTIDRLITVLEYGEPTEQRRAIRDVLLLRAQSDEVKASLTRLASERNLEVRSAARLVLADFENE